MVNLLLFIILILVGVIVFLIAKRPEIIELTDEEPKTILPKDAWLKFQNEGAKYIKRKDGKIFLRIVKY